MDSTNPYEVLGVSDRAPEEVIKAAYKALAFKHHPDRNPDDAQAAERLAAINEAFRLLSDPALKDRVDAQLRGEGAPRSSLVDGDEQTVDFNPAELFAFEADFGVTRKDPFKLGGDGITWRGEHWPLASLSGLAWGVVRGKQVEHWIRFRHPEREGEVRTQREDLYRELTAKLFIAAGQQVTARMLESLARGEAWKLDAAVVHDRGIDLPKPRLLGKTERVLAGWDEVGWQNGGGQLTLFAKPDPAARVALPYHLHFNVVLLEAVLAVLVPRRGVLLSSALAAFR